MESPRFWRLKGQLYQLIGEKCPHCGVKIFPARDICPNSLCGRNTFTYPLRSKTERDYYNEKGVSIEENVKSTRIDLEELFFK